MVGFLVGLHLFIVYLILIAGGVAVIAGIVWLILRRGATATELTAEAAASPATPGAPLDIADLARRVLRYALAVTAGLGVLQALLGGLLFLLGRRPAQPLHYVYGLIVLLGIPVAYAAIAIYGDRRQVRRNIVILTIVVTAVVAAAIRAWMTGL
jgi:hypothetical protein